MVKWEYINVSNHLLLATACKLAGNCEREGNLFELLQTL